MTSTYRGLRGLRGYSFESLHVCTHAHTRRSACFPYRRSLGITPRNPRNPATREDHAATPEPWEAGVAVAAHLHPLPTGHVRSAPARRVRLANHRRHGRLRPLPDVLDGDGQDAGASPWPTASQVATAHVGHGVARVGPRCVGYCGLVIRPTPRPGAPRREWASLPEWQANPGRNGSSLAKTGRRWPREQSPLATDFLS